MRNRYSEYLYLTLAGMCVFFLLWEYGQLSGEYVAIVLGTTALFVGLYVINRNRRVVREKKKADEMDAIRSEEMANGGLLEDSETWKF
ncbi:MAG: hypothetical protein AAF206_03795 [Bacteroidota bacterium]